MTTFLTAEWRKLAMANYAVDPSVLLPLAPAGTKLDFWEGTCYISLVGFMFLDTRVKGLSIPFHRHFEEVNLRFYVAHQTPEGENRRGVVFIQEIVPKPAIAWTANLLYGERYRAMPMGHRWTKDHGRLEVEYHWHRKGRHAIGVNATDRPEPLVSGSEAEFITEHYWGYTRINGGATSEYGVEHPSWQVYPVSDYAINVDFGEVYGQEFAFLNGQQPRSVFLAEGSPIVVRAGRKLTIKP